MSRYKKPYAAYARRPSLKALQKQKKAQAIKIKKAQTLLRQAHNLIKNIEGHEELDMAKGGIAYSHNQMSRVTEWLDGTRKDALIPLDSIDTELETVYEADVLPTGIDV